MQDKAKEPVEATVKKLNINPPEIKEMLAAGVQFGHQTQKWNPKMKDFIYTSKNHIHIIDLTKTDEKLKEAMEFLYQMAKRGNVLFVGTKKQVSSIVKDAAVNAGAYYIVHRWPGGLLTNYKIVQKSIKRLNQLESDFETGVANRTKFEVSQQKKEWEKMNRIYEGVKTLDRFPTAVIVVDTKYERLAVREATALNLPIVAMVDTNCDPTAVAYPIPANDDAVRSVRLVMETLAAAVKAGNEGHGVKHSFKDYSEVEVQTIKKEESPEILEEKELKIESDQFKGSSAELVKVPRGSKRKGILEGLQESKTSKTEGVKVVAKTLKTVKTAKEKVKKAVAKKAKAPKKEAKKGVKKAKK